MGFFAPVLASNAYQTTFSATANPISEGGRWITGLASGKDWSDVQVSGGIACGTQTGPVGPPYDDSIALWVPSNGAPWTDTQVEAQVVIPDRSAWPGSTYHEIELLLRGNINANNATFYECLFSVNAGTTYREIVRWNGPLATTADGGGAFTQLTGAQFDLTINDGDWIKATIIGTVITMYIGSTRSSYTQLGNSYDTAADSPKYASGFPGLGLWRHDSETVALTSYGVTSWHAKQL